MLLLIMELGIVRSDNESVLAIQPAQQADQPEATMKDDSRSSKTASSSSAWWQIGLIVLAIVSVITLLAAAPFCQFKKWADGLRGRAATAASEVLDDTSQNNVFQRLIGKK